jgi:DNA-binding PadR family transcriptional regulator
MLGEFEYVLITTAAGLGENAYGVAIRDEMEAAIQRKCSMGALYTTMDRLEAKGLLKTWVGEATPQRGGRGKRMVRVTPQGVRAAKEFYDSIVRISRGASWVETSWVENRMGRIS